MDLASDLLALLPEYAGFFEVNELKFKCCRKARDGSTQEVWIEVTDAGPNAYSAEHRYSVVAKTHDGRETQLKSGPSLKIALGIVAWQMLDSPKGDDQGESPPKVGPEPGLN
jgi:hypothetical protein